MHIEDATPLIEQLREAVKLGGEEKDITDRVKSTLQSFIPADGLILPERFRRVKPEGYARRPLHEDPELGFVAVAMVWGPGQKTSLHDHAGIWCVEGVLEGQMAVQQFDLLEEPEPGLFRFAGRETLEARVGSAGSLIPPVEHHVLSNPEENGQLGVTLHVYGREMNHCNVFVPEAGRPGYYRIERRDLNYDK